MFNIEKLPNGIKIAGWVITTNKQTIGDANTMKEWGNKLQLPILPEMVFGFNFLKIVSATTNEELVFDCLDALNCVDKTTLPDITVMASETWRKGNLATLEGMVGKETIKPFDWTYTTAYHGTLSPSLVVSETNEKINIAMLTDTTVPILFYDEIILFEDELADNGTSTVTIKVRVMETCLFVLQRFFLRVDGVIFRVIDTRIFLEFGKPYLIRESQKKESHYDFILDCLNKRYEEEGRSHVRENHVVAELLPLVEIKNEKIEFSVQK